MLSVTPDNEEDLSCVVSIPQQTLELVQKGACLHRYPVSTAKNGPGEAFGSECTPRGKHIIRVKIGTDCQSGTVFVGRRPTGEVYSRQLSQAEPDRDWILSRILWLSGLEPGFNRLANVDTMRRYIYIHGTADEENIGQPVSHGCIRMRNTDLIEIYDQVKLGTIVTINT